MNKLERMMVTRLLEPKDVKDSGSDLSMHVGALKMMPHEMQSMLPLAEKCLTTLPGITGAAINAPDGTLQIRYDSQVLNRDKVLAWYRLVFQEALNEAETTPPHRMTGESADAIASRARRAMNL